MGAVSAILEKGLINGQFCRIFLEVYGEMASFPDIEL